MDIFSVFTLCGGLAFFLYGMSVMSSGLEKVAGGKMESLLKKMTSNPIKSLALGLGITTVIQSSSAVTVMLVGLVNSGIMTLHQSVGVIMGSNIGTTVTAWLLSLVGIESDVFWVKLLKPSSFSPLLALAGIILLMSAKKDRHKSIGHILIGFSVLMFGMDVMSGAVKPLAEMPEFTSVLTAFSNPILGVLVGALFTAVIQSSSASVGILQALSLTGTITGGMALPIIMGQNIGTCVTALLSSIGVNRNAKRVSVVHISFNLIGTLACMALVYGVNALFALPFLDTVITPVGIASVHSIFNLFTTVLLLPFTAKLEKIANLVIKDTQKQVAYTFIDPRILSAPGMAIAQCSEKTVEMARLAQGTILAALSLFQKYDPEISRQVLADEDRLDYYEDQLGTTLVKLASKSLSKEDSESISKQLHCIGDFERIGDHAVNLYKTAREIQDKHISFSPEARRELRVLTSALTEILELTTRAYVENSLALAGQVEPLEQVIDQLTLEIKSGHIQRLQQGHCTIEMGFILSDLLTNIERVSDHCSNIAVALIETEQNAYQTHEYLNSLKRSGNESFEQAFSAYREKYRLNMVL